MSDSVANHTSDVVNNIVDKLSGGLAEVTAAVSSHAPQAWALVVGGAYAQAVANLIVGAVMLIVSLILLITGVTFIIKEKNWNDPDRGLFAIPFGVGSVILFLLFCSYGLDTHSLAMIVNPQGTVAYELIQKVLSK